MIIKTKNGHEFAIKEQDLIELSKEFLNIRMKSMYSLIHPDVAQNRADEAGKLTEFLLNVFRENNDKIKKKWNTKIRQ